MKALSLFFAALLVLVLAALPAGAQYIAPPDHTPCPGEGPFSMYFSWNPEEGALGYRHTLEKFDGFSWQFYTDVTNTQTNTTADGLMNGVYRWRVNAIHEGNAPTDWGPYWYLDENPLPVQLASFTGRVVNASSVHLDWVTVSETNNYGFDVQRRIAGTSAWYLLGFVPGNGTTLQRHDYSYTDNTATNGLWQYRLVQIDLDGTRNEVEPIQINMGPTSVAEVVPLEFALEQNYPNPFNPSTTIRFTVPVTGPVTLKVYDLVGREVAMLADEVMQAGAYERTFDASGLASGVYVYRLQSGGNVATQRMTLMK
ncbi:MAG: T9SS type A sorting domain-containing protein [bacterium]|nr:T9SS type A sorting domain-containing protein [bacterium]